MFEIIAEFIASIFVEGGFELSSDRKIPRWIRIVLFTSLSILFLSIGISLILIAFKTIIDLALKIFLGIVGLILLAIWINYFRRFIRNIKKNN